MLSAGLMCCPPARPFAQNSTPHTLSCLSRRIARAEVTPETAPAIAEVRDKGVISRIRIRDSTFTMANASGMATGHHLAIPDLRQHDLHWLYLAPAGDTSFPSSKKMRCWATSMSIRRRYLNENHLEGGARRGFSTAADRQSRANADLRSYRPRRSPAFIRW